MGGTPEKMNSAHAERMQRAWSAQAERMLRKLSTGEKKVKCAKPKNIIACSANEHAGVIPKTKTIPGPSLY